MVLHGNGRGNCKLSSMGSVGKQIRQPSSSGVVFERTCEAKCLVAE